MAARDISIHALLAESDCLPVSAFIDRATYFYPRSPCGERHAARAALRAHRYFYPRSPCGERLCLYRLSLIAPPISIHALLAESDLPVSAFIDRATYFYPRSPCGERLACIGFH